VKDTDLVATRRQALRQALCVEFRSTDELRWVLVDKLQDPHRQT